MASRRSNAPRLVTVRIARDRVVNWPDGRRAVAGDEVRVSKAEAEALRRDGFAEPHESARPSKPEPEPEPEPERLVFP